ncbi:uncharacterized protein si:dkey-27p18.3 isoform X2 [Danio aesculapii]|uniref:uncharacterized protein si:dkey-27p18.3 isoform X2 n=1 Tax=Danio aesculapii TaxID=1142201 RepID=UPI0024BFDD2E|nr:uncharacterized protein si:dkey-27p18.3 isoform X2 [Danio aesculapii]
MDVETSTMSNMRDLTSAISTVDLEIEWFKKTDCVYSHKIQNSLPLKNESGVGVYLCQVTCEDRIKNINISLKEAPGTEQTSTCKLNDKQWTDNERINKTCSALLAVFSTLQKVLQIDGQGDEAAKHLDKQQQGCPEYKDYDRKDNNASVQQTRKKVKQKEIKPEEKDPRQENKRQESTKQSESTAMETSPFQPFDKGNLFNKELDCAEKSKGTKTDRQGDDDQNEAGENLDNQQPGSPEKSKGQQIDRQGDDDQNEAGENLDNQQPGSPENKDYDKKDNNASVQQTRKKVEHKETNPEEKDTRQEYTSTEESWTIIPMDTSPSQPVNEDSLGNHQLDCADQGQSQLPDELHKGEEESQELQAKKPKNERKGGTMFSIVAGKINYIHKKFIVHLQDRIQDLTEAQRVEDSDVVLIFCPIVSRAGTDIDAALAKIDYTPASKLTILVVLHHTFDPEKTISNSSKCVNKENLLTVDCLFYEDTGLLDCQRNSDAFDKSVNWLIQQGHTIGSSFQHKIHSSLPRLQLRSWRWEKKQETSGDNKKRFPFF